jgi:hypothetical protein
MTKGKQLEGKGTKNYAFGKKEVAGKCTVVITSGTLPPTQKLFCILKNLRRS